MIGVYRLGYQLYRLGVNLASPFHEKAKKWVQGRKSIFEDIAQIPANKKVIWFHAASLGEYEMGRPVIAKLREQHPEHFILVTFFSPSGYENRKDDDLIDLATYLPHDTASSAKKFLEKVNPVLAVFIKYEFWPSILKECFNRSIPVNVISATFREGQFIFSSLGRPILKLLSRSTFIGVQDQSSLDLLKFKGFTNAVLTGDSRFDNVMRLSHESYSVPALEDWFNMKPTIVCGSIWPEDEEILLPQIMRHPYFNFVLAPHDVKASNVRRLRDRLPAKSVTWSELDGSEIDDETPIMILDTIGQLSRLYRFGKIAYVGGGFKTGLHNILEPAAYGMPVLFGPQHQKFWEAEAMKQAGGGFEVHSVEEVNALLQRFGDRTDVLANASQAALQFVRDHAGATELTVQHLHRQL